MIFKFFIFLNMALIASFTLAAGSTSQPTSCSDLVENFCSKIYEPQYQGNYDFVSDNYKQTIRLGRTPNAFSYAKFYFLESLQKNIKLLPKDLQLGLKRARFSQKFSLYLHRKKIAQRTEVEIYDDQWTGDSFYDFETLVDKVASERTNKVYPDFIHRTVDDMSFHELQFWHTQIDLIWAEVLTAVWQKQSGWIEAQSVFEKVRTEYINWVQDDKTISEALRVERLENLRSLKLTIPGSNPQVDREFGLRCATGQANAFYLTRTHEVYLCSGVFTVTNSLQILAHEVGHSIGIQRRFIKFFEKTSAGKDLFSIWNTTTLGEKLKCEVWTDLKKRLENDLNSQKQIVFEDSDFLRGFLSKKPLLKPNSADIYRIADRMAKQTMRGEIDANDISSILKKTETLKSGRRVTNEIFMDPAHLDRWPQWLSFIDFPGRQFDFFFTQEYNCQLNEKKISPDKALEASVVESERLTELVWEFLLKVPGEFSYITTAVDENIAQNIEEDVVDSYGSTILSRLLLKMPNIIERRATYLAAVAFHCDPPSFLNSYPEESLILHSFSNEPHSIGRDRRNKLLTKQVREALQCQ